MSTLNKTLRKRLLALCLAAMMLLGTLGYSAAALSPGRGALVYAAVTPTDASPADASSADQADTTTPTTRPETTSHTDAAPAVFEGSVVECRGHKYQYVERNFSWDEAEAWCAGQGGYLATIGSQYENDFIAGYLSGCGNKGAYIGISGTDGSDFAWANGESLAFLNWAQRQPVMNGSTVYGRVLAGAAQWSSGSGEERPLGFLIEWGPKAPLPDSDEKSANSTAVIIIPGMGGSVLKNSAGAVLWSEESQDLTALRLEGVSASRSDLIPDGENLLYEAIVEQAGTVCSNSDVCLFQWDWRKDPNLAAEKLGDMIKTKGWSQVTLIGHDIGGLLACDYMKINGGDKIDKLITLGTPFYGSTRAIYTIMSGVFCDGLSVCSGETNNSVSTFASLASILPCDRAEKVLGRQGITGALTSYYDNTQLADLLSVSSNSQCKSLYTFYDAIKDKFADKIFVVASTGVPTLSGIAVNEDVSGVERVYATTLGDGNSLISSTAPDFGARAPYIISGIDSGELVSDESALQLVGNLLSDLGDTADYNKGCELDILRETPKQGASLLTITASRAAELSVSNEHGGINLGSTRYSIGGTGHPGYICADGAKIIFTTDRSSMVNINILEPGAMLEVSNAKKTRLRWSKLPDEAGTALTMRISEGKLTTTDDANVTIPYDKWSTVTKAEEAPHKGYKPTWYDLGALGCFIAAAALCFIGIPMCAFGLTKIDILQKREMKKRAALMKKQMRINQKLGIYQQQPYNGNNNQNNYR